VTNLALIGCGYWGPNYARTIAQVPGARLAWCCDVSEAALERIREEYPGVKTSHDYRKVLRAPDCDAVIVAVPTQHHVAIASAALAAGKPVLVEKPVAPDARAADELADLAERSGLVAMVGHIYVFNPDFRAVLDRVRGGELGTLRSLRCERVGFSPIRDDVDALWDLAPHDVAMLLKLTGSLPDLVFAAGNDYVRKGRADVVFATFRFPGGAVAQLNVSWDFPEKVRKLTVVGDRGIAIFDDGAAEEKVREFVRGATVPEPGSRECEVIFPPPAAGNPLALQIIEFLAAIERGHAVESDLREGAAVIRVLEALTESMRSARPIALLESVPT
jgi:predicted dehydrogenase